MRLTRISLPEALRVSALADQTGKGAFLLDYVTKYGSDPVAMKALLNASPEAVKLYVEQTASPDSTLAHFSVSTGLRLSSLASNYGIDPVEPLFSAKPAAGNWTDYVSKANWDRVSRAFQSEPKAITLDENLSVYRYWSGSPAKEVGPWVTPESTLTPGEARALLALPDSNLATNITKFTIPKGTTILIGQAAEQTLEPWAGSYATGEGLQIYIQDPTILIKAP